jgi:hypothetical protein
VTQWAAFGFFACLAAFGFWRLLRARMELPRLVRLAVVLQLCAAPALPLTSSDVFCNLAYGRVAVLGQNPYTVAPAQLPDGDPFRAVVYERWAGYPTPYGPTVAWFNAAAAAAGTVGGALALFKMQMLAAMLLALLLGAAICRTRSNPQAFALLGCNPLLAWELSGQAHNDALLVLALCAFAYGAVRERWPLALLSLALALWTKPVAVPVFGLVLLWQLRTAPRRGLLLLAGTAALGALLYAPFWAGPATLAAILRELRGDPGHLTHSLTAVLYEVGGLFAYRVMQVVSLGVVGFFAVRAALRATTLEETARGAAIFYLVYGLVAAPWMQAWYISWIPPLLLMVEDVTLHEVTALWSVLWLAQYAIPFHTATAVVVNGVPLTWWAKLRLRPSTP